MCAFECFFQYLNLENPASGDVSSESLICWDLASGEGKADFEARTGATQRLQELFAALASDSAREEFLRVAKFVNIL